MLAESDALVIFGIKLPRWGHPRSWRILSLLFLATIGLPAAAEEDVSFNQDIRPIFSKKCMTCHGPDAGNDEHGKSKRKAGLRLDRADGPEGAYRVIDGVQAIKPGDLERSELWRRITTDDADDVMPPAKSHVDPLTAAEKNLVKKRRPRAERMDARLDELIEESRQHS